MSLDCAIDAAPRKGKRRLGVRPVDPKGDDVANKVGWRIRRRRKELGRTMEECAPGVGVSYQQWSKYESGENLPSVRQLIKIAAVLDCPLDFLLADFLGSSDSSEWMRRDAEARTAMLDEARKAINAASMALARAR